MNADANRRDDERRKMLIDSLWTAYTDTTAFLLGNQDGSPLILYTSTNQTEKDALYTKIVTEQWGAERIQREKPETDPLFQVIFLLGVQWETEDAVFYMDRDEVCYVITFWDDCFSVFEPSAVFEPGTELYTIYQYTDEFFLKRMGNVFERWNEGGQEKGFERFEGVVAFYRLEGGILSLP